MGITRHISPSSSISTALTSPGFGACPVLSPTQGPCPAPAPAYEKHQCHPQLKLGCQRPFKAPGFSARQPGSEPGRCRLAPHATCRGGRIAVFPLQFHATSPRPPRIGNLCTWSRTRNRESEVAVATAAEAGTPKHELPTEQANPTAREKSPTLKEHTCCQCGHNIWDGSSCTPPHVTAHRVLETPAPGTSI